MGKPLLSSFAMSPAAVTVTLAARARTTSAKSVILASLIAVFAGPPPAELVIASFAAVLAAVTAVNAGVGVGKSGLPVIFITITSTMDVTSVSGSLINHPIAAFTICMFSLFLSDRLFARREIQR